jgi:polyhydroxyalkanoate synthase
MASKAETGGSAKAGKKKSQKKGAPFSGVAGAFDAANDATMALGPLAGLAREDFIGAIGLMLRQTAANPDKAWKATTSFSEDVVKIMTGKSDLAPDPKDKRFMDPAWTFNPFFKAGAQYYLAVQKGVKSYIQDLELDALERDRANFISQIIIDAMSPTNTLIGNPTAQKQAGSAS